MADIRGDANRAIPCLQSRAEFEILERANLVVAQLAATVRPRLWLVRRRLQMLQMPVRGKGDAGRGGRVDRQLRESRERHALGRATQILGRHVHGVVGRVVAVAFVAMVGGSTICSTASAVMSVGSARVAGERGRCERIPIVV